MSPRRPAAELRPGTVAYLLEPGELGPTYRPVEVVKVNRATATVRDAAGLRRVALEELTARSPAGTPEPPASRAEEAVERFQKATEELEAARARELEAARRRREALLELEALGWTLTAMARHLGLTPGRVHQIIRGES